MLAVQFPAYMAYSSYNLADIQYYMTSLTRSWHSNECNTGLEISPKAIQVVKRNIANPEMHMPMLNKHIRSHADNGVMQLSRPMQNCPNLSTFITNTHIPSLPSRVGFDQYLNVYCFDRGVARVPEKKFESFTWEANCKILWMCETDRPSASWKKKNTNLLQ